MTETATETLTETPIETAMQYVGRATVTPAAPRHSIIVPTYNERDNIEALLKRLTAVLPATSTEIVFVDDSTDDTPEIIRTAAERCPIPVVVHHRDSAEGGLGGAVVEGMRRATGRWIVVMDADLQHPPEIVPDLIAAGERDGADLVVGTRYAGGGARDGLADRYRRLVSKSSTLATKLVFRTALIQVSDPMSGLFAVRATSLDIDELRPIGFKILLELLVRNRPGRIVEVPYTFQPRHAGQSKSSFAEGKRFLKHMATLRLGERRLRMLAYALIGVSGLAPNQLVLWALAGAFGLHYLAAAVLANVVAVGWNFALADLLLFRHRRHRSLTGRFGRFFLMGNTDLLLRIPVLALLVNDVRVDYLVANLATLVASFLVRFVVLDRIVYLAKPIPVPAEA
jgi:dolichol-phosphate mannosyltransferase